MTQPSKLLASKVLAQMMPVLLQGAMLDVSNTCAPQILLPTCRAFRSYAGRFLQPPQLKERDNHSPVRRT